MSLMNDEWVLIHEVHFGGAEGGLTLRLGAGPVGVLVSRACGVRSLGWSGVRFPRSRHSSRCAAEAAEPFRPHG